MIAFLEKLTLNRRLALFAVLGIVLVAPPLTMFLQQSWKQIGITRTEQAGLTPAIRLLNVVQLVQHHRGMSANVLGGNAGMETQRVAKQLEIEKAIEAAAAALQESDASEALRTSAERAAADWAALAQQVGARSISGKESFVKHTGLIATYLDTVDQLADHFRLSLDPEPVGHQMILAVLFHIPRLAETLGQARARGTLYLAQGKISETERTELRALATTLGVSSRDVMRTLDKALEARPELKTSLSGVLAEADSLSETALQLTRERIVEAEPLSYSSTEYFTLYTQAIDTQFKLLEASFRELDGILAARAGELVRTQATILGLIALVILASLGVGIAVARSILRQLGGEPAYAAEVAAKVAAGDLSVAVETRENDRSSLLRAMKTMVENLTGTVCGIKEASEAISTAAREISQGNADLSSRTEEQAGSLEETASSMEELTSTVTQNAENARQANQLAIGTSQAASRGGEVVREVISTMKGISESSKKIADITSVIDAIAFQTNILALNAAVEAARAGEQGRGFAVVASEVRNLAQKSAAAAKEISALISDSAERVEAGSRLVDQAGTTMDEIVAAIKRVTDIMGEITAASHEQSSGIGQINQAVTQMDRVTQQNAALVEEAAAAAESMADQAKGLVQMVAQFRLAQDAQAPASMPPSLLKTPRQSADAAQPAGKPTLIERRGPKRARNVVRLAQAGAAAQPAAATRATGTHDDWIEF